MKWQTIDTAPKTGRKLILGYKNTLGNWRSIMGFYAQPKTLDANSEYIDGDEDGFAPEGWYEDSETQSETLLQTDRPPTHWMPLPEPPDAEPEPGDASTRL